MILRPPRSTLVVSSAASDVYKRQVIQSVTATPPTDLESILASITVAQVTTTKRLSGEDS